MIFLFLLALSLILIGGYLTARSRGRLAGIPGHHATPDDLSPPPTMRAGESAPGDGRPAERLPAPLDHDPPESDGPARAPTPESETPPIDLTVIERLRSAGQDEDTHILPALIDAFLHSGPAQLDQIETGLRDDSPLAALTALGLFRTSARLLGATPLEARGASLQAAIEARDTSTANDALAEMRARFGSAESALRAHAGFVQA